MSTGNKVIIVELNEPYKDKKRWVFGSKTAIYQHLPVSVVGIALTTLQCKVNLSNPYTTSTGTISQDYILRASTNRGRRKEENND
jgi:hypothetical protein